MARKLLMVTAVFEAATGAGLLLAPALLVSLLLGVALEGGELQLVARVLGAALLALGLACWIARDDGRSRAATGLIAGLLLYNVVVLGLLAHAWFGLDLRAIGLWPAAAAHFALAAWCLLCLRPRGSART